MMGEEEDSIIEIRTCFQSMSESTNESVELEKVRQQVPNVWKKSPLLANYIILEERKKRNNRVKKKKEV